MTSSMNHSSPAGRGRFVVVVVVCVCVCGGSITCAKNAHRSSKQNVRQTVVHESARSSAHLHRARKNIIHLQNKTPGRRQRNTQAAFVLIKETSLSTRCPLTLTSPLSTSRWSCRWSSHHLWCTKKCTCRCRWCSYPWPSPARQWVWAYAWLHEDMIRASDKGTHSNACMHIPCHTN